MRLVLHVLGTEILSLEMGGSEQAEADDDPGSCTSYPVGFTASEGDQRWAEVDVPDYTGWDE